MRIFELGLATWRLSRMLVRETGPYDAFARLRLATGIEYGLDGQVISYPPYNPLHCVYCTSVYTAIAVLLMPRWLRTLLSVSGMATLIEACVVEAEARI
jgi:hypothetical protein